MCITQDAEYIKDVLAASIEEVGADNVVQVVLDGASACGSAGRKLEQKYVLQFICILCAFWREPTSS